MSIVNQTTMAVVPADGLRPGDFITTSPWPDPVEVVYMPKLRQQYNGRYLVDVAVRLPWGIYTTVLRLDESFTVVR